MEVIIIKFGKSGKSEINWPLVMLFVIVILIAFPAIPEKLQEVFGLESTPVAPVTPTVPTAPMQGCYIEDTSMTVNSEEMYNPTTAVEGDHNVWINGYDQSNYVEGGSLTVSPGDTYKILWAENSSATGHYGMVSEGVVPCSGTLKLHAKLYDMDIGAAQTTWSTLWNDDGTLNAGSGTEYNLTLGLGEVVDLTVKLKATFEDSIGNPYGGEYPNVLSCKYNSTSMDDVIISKYTEVETPSMITPVGGWKFVSWKFPALVSNDNPEQFIITVDVDETYDPVDKGSWLICQLDDGDYDIHSDNGDIIFGVEDDKDAVLGVAQALHNFSFSVS